VVSCPSSVASFELSEPSQVAGGSGSLNTNWLIGLGVGKRGDPLGQRLLPTFH